MIREARIILVIGGRGSGKTYLLENRLQPKDTIVVEYMKTPRWSGYQKIFFTELISGKVSEKALCNSQVVFEDATSYISSNMSNYLRRLIVNSKQMGSDVYLIFHSINVVPTFLWYLWNNIILFKCAKPRETALNADYFNEIMQKWNKCMKSKQYHYEEIISQL